MIRVLVVDDSAVLRQSTRFILESDPDLRVVGEASNGVDAIALAGKLQPDVITMDIRMPKMDGLEAIREIMTEHPVPIIVVTGLDLDKELGISKRAAQLGAVAVLKRSASRATPGYIYQTFANQLIQQVKSMSAVKVVHRIKPSPTEGDHPTGAAGIVMASPLFPPLLPRKIEIVAIGSSTGGPAALHRILSKLPGGFPLPIVIVQHISFGFVEGLASWLNDASPLRVKVGQHNERLLPGMVYIAPDDYHMLINRFKQIELRAAAPVGGHRPAVTALFESVAQSYGAAALAAILTGMGADGALGMKALYAAGALTVAQDQASCVVFGMPKEAIAQGAARHIVPLDQIAQTIQDLALVQELS